MNTATQTLLDHAWQAYDIDPPTTHKHDPCSLGLSSLRMPPTPWHPT